MELLVKRIVSDDEESVEYLSFLQDVYTDLLVASQWVPFEFADLQFVSVACRVVFAAHNEPDFRPTDSESEGERRSRRANASKMYHTAGCAVYASHPAREEGGRRVHRSAFADKRDGNACRIAHL